AELLAGLPRRGERLDRRSDPAARGRGQHPPGDPVLDLQPAVAGGDEPELLAGVVQPAPLRDPRAVGVGAGRDVRHLVAEPVAQAGVAAVALLRPPLLAGAVAPGGKADVGALVAAADVLHHRPAGAADQAEPGGSAADLLAAGE